MDFIAHPQSQANLNPRLQPLAFNLFNGRGLSNQDESHIPFCSTLSEQAMADLIKKSKTVRYLRRWTIDAESNQDDLIYIIFSGKVSMYSGEVNNTFGIHDSGSCLREIAVLTNQLRSSAIITLERAVFTTVKKFDFVNWLMKYPEVTLSYVGRLP